MFIFYLFHLLLQLLTIIYTYYYNHYLLWLLICVYGLLLRLLGSQEYGRCLQKRSLPCHVCCSLAMMRLPRWGSTIYFTVSQYGLNLSSGFEHVISLKPEPIAANFPVYIYIHILYIIMIKIKKNIYIYYIYNLSLFSGFEHVISLQSETDRCQFPSVYALYRQIPSSAST